MTKEGLATDNGIGSLSNQIQKKIGIKVNLFAKKRQYFQKLKILAEQGTITRKDPKTKEMRNYSVLDLAKKTEETMGRIASKITTLVSQLVVVNKHKPGKNSMVREFMRQHGGPELRRRFKICIILSGTNTGGSDIPPHLEIPYQWDLKKYKEKNNI